MASGLDESGLREMTYEELLEWQRNLPGKTYLCTLEGYGAATIIHFPENPVPGNVIEGKDVVPARTD